MRSSLHFAALAVAFALASCSSSTSGSPLARGEAVLDDLSQTECECFWSADGYSSIAECLADNSDPFGDITCVNRAYANHATELRPTFDCYLGALEQLRTCTDGAGCDETAFEACGTAFDSQRGLCPEPPAAAIAAYESEVEACTSGEPSGCPDTSIGSMVGSGVRTGTTLRAGNDLASDCGGEDAPDVAYTWTAPEAGTWVFDTFGSTFDTVLYIRTGCLGEELDCDDDSGDGLQSEIEIDLSAGQEVLIVVDGLGSSDAGDFVLNIRKL